MKYVLIALALAGSAPSAIAAVSYSVSGSTSSGHFGMQTHESRAGSVGVDYALTRQFEVGVNHRQELANQHGFKEIEDASGKRTVPFTTDARMITNAATLTYALFAEAPAVPYVFGGIAHNMVYAKEVEGSQTSSFAEPSLGPQVGLGLRVRMSKELMLRVSYTVSPGTVVPDAAHPADTVSKVNSYAMLGIAFHP